MAQSRDRVEPTPSYWNTEQPYPVVDKERPGRGYRHLLRKQDMLRFIELMPNWNELAEGLDAIVLARGENGLEGWYTEGVVGICAWERDLWRRHPIHYFEENEGVFRRLGVEFQRRGERVLCKFTENQARAFQLLNILMHELGHHHDRISTRSKFECSRGEPYAEEYALRYERIIWERYIQVFDMD
ncbi:MAG: hypothetical protein OEM59_01500 [Rhodospirillales bacterium]|nr:hypothetical protein [Rhodospirillales bacterium]